MKRLVILAVIAVLSGCVEQPMLLIHKTGSTMEERRYALDQCEFEAINVVPRAMATQVSGGYYSPGSIQCSTIGMMTSCNRVGAINIPATATTYDANQDLRTRYIARCLERSGFNVYERPVCRTEAERRAFLASADNQPTATEIPCVNP